MRDIGRPLQRLCAMKNTTELTPFGLETWVAALSVFDSGIVSRAVVEIGLSSDPFPDLGKIFARCESLRRSKSGTQPTDGSNRLSDATIRRAAAAMGLVIE